MQSPEGPALKFLALSHSKDILSAEKLLRFAGVRFLSEAVTMRLLGGTTLDAWGSPSRMLSEQRSVRVKVCVFVGACVYVVV